MVAAKQELKNTPSAINSTFYVQYMLVDVGSSNVSWTLPTVPYTVSIGCVHFVTLNVILLSTGGTNASCHSRWKILECGLVLSLCVQISAQTGAPYDICSGTFDEYFSNLCTCTPPPIVSILCSAVFATCTVVCLHR